MEYDPGLEKVASAGLPPHKASTNEVNGLSHLP